MRKIVFVFLIAMCLTACNDKQNVLIPNEKTISTASPSLMPIKRPPESPAMVTPAPSGKDIASLMPKGWHMLERVKGKPEMAQGDLNKDGIPDVALVIEEISKAEQAPPRALLIAIGMSDKTYTTSIIADNAILKRDEGGVWGDPFERITIDEGSMVLNFYGGSNDRWYARYRFRYQQNGWFLIGVTLGEYFTGTTTIEHANEEDYNLLTGDYIFRKADDQGIMRTTKGNRGIQPLVNLKDFDVRAEKQF